MCQQCVHKPGCLFLFIYVFEHQPSCFLFHIKFFHCLLCQECHSEHTFLLKEWPSTVQRASEHVVTGRPHEEGYEWLTRKGRTANCGILQEENQAGAWASYDGLAAIFHPHVIPSKYTSFFALPYWAYSRLVDPCVYNRHDGSQAILLKGRWNAGWHNTS